MAVCICRKGTHDEKLAWTFRLYDTDGSGSIDFEEVRLDPFSLLPSFKAVNKVETTFLQFQLFLLPDSAPS